MDIERVIIFSCSVNMHAKTRLKGSYGRGNSVHEMNMCVVGNGLPDRRRSWNKES
jgi:hypothetical protein